MSRIINNFFISLIYMQNILLYILLVIFIIFILKIIFVKKIENFRFGSITNSSGSTTYSANGVSSTAISSPESNSTVKTKAPEGIV